MKYNENFVKWITFFILSIASMIMALIFLTTGIVISIISEDSGYAVASYISFIVFIIIYFVDNLIANDAKNSWALESKNKSEE